MARKIGTVLLVAFVILATAYQLFDLYRFVNFGARFTLNDGQALCARVVWLEAHQGLVPGNCMFGGESW